MWAWDIANIRIDSIDQLFHILYPDNILCWKKSIPWFNDDNSYISIPPSLLILVLYISNVYNVWLPLTFQNDNDVKKNVIETVGIHYFQQYIDANWFSFQFRVFRICWFLLLLGFFFRVLPYWVYVCKSNKFHVATIFQFLDVFFLLRLLHSSFLFFAGLCSEFTLS